MTEHDDDLTLPLQKSAPVPAKRPGRYELLDRLGKGGMGVVYRARDTKLDRPVAVKLLLGDLEGDGETRERFLREARADPPPAAVPLVTRERSSYLAYQLALA